MVSQIPILILQSGQFKNSLVALSTLAYAFTTEGGGENGSMGIILFYFFLLLIYKILFDDCC